MSHNVVTMTVTHKQIVTVVTVTHDVTLFLFLLHLKVRKEKK